MSNNKSYEKKTKLNKKVAFLKLTQDIVFKTFFQKINKFLFLF